MHRKEGKMKKWTDIIEKLTMLTQLSLSLVTPLYFVWGCAGGAVTAGHWVAGSI